MPKTKLTEEKRATLRQEIARGVKAGTRQSRIFDTLGKKYGVSPETIRYYLKALRKNGPGAPKKGPAKRSPKTSNSSKNSKTRRPAGTLSPKSKPHGLPHVRLADVVKGLTAKDLVRALEAKKLLPALEASRAKASDLRAKAREAARQVTRLERQFKKLVH